MFAATPLILNDDDEKKVSIFLPTYIFTMESTGPSTFFSRVEWKKGEEKDEKEIEICIKFMVSQR